MTGVAALIAAASFAVLACAGVYLAVRLTRVLGEATALVRETRAEQQAVLARASAAVDRAHAQLDRTDAVASSMEDLGTGVAELAGQVTALAGMGRALASGPVGRAAAVAYGVRHAFALRRGQRRGAAIRGVSGGSLPLGQAERAVAGQVLTGTDLVAGGRKRRKEAR
jgi:hypothetical protein